MKTLILSCLLLVCFSQDFEAYIVKFKREYADDQEKSIREAIYLNNWVKIN